MTNEVVVLATRIELGLADLGELSDFVDRRIAEGAPVEGELLELATPLELAIDDVSSRLERLSGETPARAAAMRVLVVTKLFDEGRLTLDRAVGYLSVRIAPHLPKPLDGTCGALDDILALALSGTYGTREMVAQAMRALADDCAFFLAS